MSNRIVCRPKSLPRDQWVRAAQEAAKVNPANRAPVERMATLFRREIPREYIAAVTTKYWRSGGVRLSVQFLDTNNAELRTKILANMNAWGTRASVRFVATDGQGEVRIARKGGDDGGYWSYVGTDILQIPVDAPTLNLESFTVSTPDSEFVRVVRHETGHTMGFPHEHMRQDLVAKIDPAKAVTFFRATQGWSEAEVYAQVLTPIEESSLIGTPDADGSSIMCYQIPGSITRDGQPILGGTDIDEQDYAFVAKLYPKTPTDDNASGSNGSNGHRVTIPGGSVLWFAPGTDPSYIATVVAAFRVQ